jgi:hypothetical protein
MPLNEKASLKNSLRSRQSAIKLQLPVSFCASVEIWLAKSSASEAVPTTV